LVDCWIIVAIVASLNFEKLQNLLISFGSAWQPLPGPLPRLPPTLPATLWATPRALLTTRGMLRARQRSKFMVEWFPYL
jgi:hypothetical protein